MFAASLLLAATVFSKTDTISRADVQRELSALVRVDALVGPNGRDSVRVVAFAVDRVPQGSLLEPFLQAHGRLVWYLAAHTPGAEARIVGERDDATAVRDSVRNVLRSNPGFNERVLGMLASYWHDRGPVIEGQAVPLPSTVSVAQLSRVATRFFYPDRFSATGDTLFTHICAGINGLKDLPEPVDPLIEAFVFLAVNSAVFVPKSPLMSAFELASKHAKVTSASKDPTTRLYRAQGALWAELEGSAALGEALERSYEQQRAVLPFRIARAP